MTFCSPKGTKGPVKTSLQNFGTWRPLWWKHGVAQNLQMNITYECCAARNPHLDSFSLNLNTQNFHTED